MDLITTEEIEVWVASTTETVDYRIPCWVKVKRRLISGIYHHRGLLFAFASAWCYAGMTMTVSALTDTVSSMELVFVRAFVTLCISAIILIRQGISIRPESLREVKFHIINATVSTVSILCQFYAYQNMRTADASAIVYGYVAFTGLLGKIFLKEAFGWFEALTILFTFTGTIFIARPPFLFGSPKVESSDEDAGFLGLILPPIMALNGSIFGALMMVILRAMQKRRFVSMKTVFHFSLYTLVLMAVPLTVLRRWSVPHCIAPRLLALLMGFMAFLGYSLVNLAVSVEDAVYVSLVNMNEVYIVFFLDIVIFGFQPRWLSVIGTFLIVGSSVVTSIRKIIKKRQDGASSEPKDQMVVIEASDCSTPDDDIGYTNQFFNGEIHSTFV